MYCSLKMAVRRNKLERNQRTKRNKLAKKLCIYFVCISDILHLFRNSKPRRKSALQLPHTIQESTLNAICVISVSQIRSHIMLILFKLWFSVLLHKFSLNLSICVISTSFCEMNKQTDKRTA
jgi:hypothetical protein